MEFRGIQWRKVTKEEFFAYINPRDIVLDTQREYTFWKTRMGYEVGMSNGWINSENKEKWLRADL